MGRAAMQLGQGTSQCSDVACAATLVLPERVDDGLRGYSFHKKYVHFRSRDKRFGYSDTVFRIPPESVRPEFFQMPIFF